jgi:predicted NBD/HSP70 family sugar kinase
VAVSGSSPVHTWLMRVTEGPDVDLGHRSSRDANKAAIMQAILAKAPVTRAQVIDSTGLSKATMSRAVDELRAAGYIEDGAVDTAEGRGRRSTYLDVPSQIGHIVGASLGLQTTRILVTDLLGREGWQISLDTPSFDEAGDAANWLIKLIARATRQTPGSLRQIAVAVPAHVRDGREIVGAVGPRALIYGNELHERISDRFRVPVLLDSDANLALLGAIAAEGLGEDENVQDAVLFNVSTVLTVAVCHGKELVRGRSDAFGHIELLPSGVGRLTLGNALSTSGLEVVAARMNKKFDHVEELWAHGRQVDGDLLDLVQVAVATAVTVAAVTFDAKVVLFSGRLEPLVHSVLPAVGAALPPALATMHVATTSQRERNMSTIRGASFLAREAAQRTLLLTVMAGRSTN